MINLLKQVLNTTVLTNLSEHKNIFLNICIHHIFTHSSIDGHLGRFCILAVVHNAGMNRGAYIFSH